MLYFIQFFFLNLSSDITFSTISGESWSKPNNGISTIDKEISKLEGGTNRHVRGLWKDLDTQEENCRHHLELALAEGIEKVHISLILLNTRIIETVVSALKARNAVALEDILSDDDFDFLDEMNGFEGGNVFMEATPIAKYDPHLINIIIHSDKFLRRCGCDALFIFPLICAIGNLETVQLVINNLRMLGLLGYSKEFLKSGFILSMVFGQWKVFDLFINVLNGQFYVYFMEYFMLYLVALRAIPGFQHVMDFVYDFSISEPVKYCYSVLLVIEMSMRNGAPPNLLNKFLIHLIKKLRGAMRLQYFNQFMTELEACGFIDQTARLVIVGDSYIPYRA